MRGATRALAARIALLTCATCSSCSRREEPSRLDASVPSTPSASGAPSASSSMGVPARGAHLAPVMEEDRSSSALALGTIANRPVAILADEDDARLRVLALPAAGVDGGTSDDRGREIVSAKLAGTPGHVVVAKDGTIFVAIRDQDIVEAFAIACTNDVRECTITEGARIRTAQEPLALALVKNELLVVSTWGRELARYALPSGDKIEATPLGREPRALLAARDGKSVVVTHAAGSIVTTVSLAPGLPSREEHLDYRDQQLAEGSSTVLGDEPRFAGQGFAVARAGDRLIAPMVLVYPGDAVPTQHYGPEESPFFPNEPVLVAITDPPDDTPPRLRVRIVTLTADKPRVSIEHVPPSAPPCLLPRASAADEARRSVLVACTGIDQLIELDSADAPLAFSELRRWSLPAGPSAIAVDPRAREAWVWSQHARKLSRIALGSASPRPEAPDGGRARVAPVLDVETAIPIAAETTLDPIWLRGRQLFHTAITADGRACASCHPDGRTDGLTWASPKGALQTPMLFGRLATTAPYGWFGDSTTLEGHLALTLSRLRARPVDDAERAALATYVARAKTFLSQRKRTEEEERGRRIFESSETGCTQCHAGDASQRDVGTGGSFDTPSLRFVGGTAPYMHDGRYATLREVLVRTEGRMGTTRHLGEKDLLALIAYLRSLQ